MITQLNVRAFKGLHEFNIKPQRVNLLIGANGTGKTNFTDLVAFIASLCPRGLAAAIEEFGGLERVRTRQPGAGTPFLVLTNPLRCTTSGQAIPSPNGASLWGLASPSSTIHVS